MSVFAKAAIIYLDDVLRKFVDLQCRNSVVGVDDCDVVWDSP